MNLFRMRQHGGDPLPTQSPPEPHPKQEAQLADRSAHTSNHEGHLSGTEQRHPERAGDHLDVRNRKDLQSQRAPARIKSGGAPHGRGNRNKYNHKHRGQMGENNTVSEFTQQQQRGRPESLQGARDPPEQGRTQECREGPGTRQQQTQQAEQRDELQRPRREQKRWTRDRGHQPQHNYQWRPVVRENKEEKAQQQQPQNSQQVLEQSVSQKQLQTQKEHLGEQPTRQQQQQRQRTHTRGTQQRYPQGRHVQRQQCDKIHNEQRSNSQQSHLPGEQLKQQQPSVNCRRVCVRPQPTGVASSVAMELQRLRRQFFGSFSLLFCHPRLMTLLEHQPSADREWKKTPARNSSLDTRDSKVPTAIEDASKQRKSAGNADGSSIGAPVDPKPTNDVPYTDGYSCEKLPAGGYQLGSSTPLCVFKVILNPTDPEFDKFLLPCGLRLQVTVEKNYPGSEAIFTSEQDGDMPSRGGKMNDGVNGQDNATVVAATVATASADSANYIGEGDSHPPPATKHGCGPVDAHSCEIASSVASLYVCNEELNDFRRNAIEMVFSKVIEQQLARGEKADLVRTAIKAVDRHLREVFELQVPHTESASQKVEMPWTEEEQRKLEEAVVLYRRVAEPVLRWRNISSHVGTRTAKECAMRFQICRSAVLNERQKVSEGTNTKEESGEPSDGPEDELDGEDGENNTGVSARTPAVARGSDISLIDTTSEGVSSLHLSCIRLQVTCGRCKTPADMRVSLPKDGAALDAAGCSVTCAKCQLRMGIKVQPLIGVTGSSLMRVAVVEEIDCHLKDLMPCDFVLTCDCCGASMKARELQSGSPRTNHCRHCHSKIAFGFQGAALGHAVVCGLGAEGSKSRPTPSFHQRQRKQDLRIVVGTPLADYGTCKHYKKSFRWLRFPCCGKAYPCDICHDNNEDHEHEWATRMICGFCSVEQAFANGKPCSCGKALTKGGASAHWEGGKGCRDRTRMSRKDSRKYKGLSK